MGILAVFLQLFEGNLRPFHLVAERWSSIVQRPDYLSQPVVDVGNTLQSRTRNALVAYGLS